MGSTEPPEFNEDSLCIPKRQKCVLGKQKGPDANKGQERKRLRKEKVSVREKMKLTKVRNNFLGSLFMLKEVVSSIGQLTKFKVYAQK